MMKTIKDIYNNFRWTCIFELAIFSDMDRPRGAITYYRCPNCRAMVGIETKRYKHHDKECGFCSTKLTWRNTNETTKV